MPSLKSNNSRAVSAGAWALAVICVFAVMCFMDRETALGIREFNKTDSAFNSTYNAVLPFIKFITNGGTLIAGSVLLYLYGRYIKRGIGLPERLGSALIAAYAFSGISVQVLKHLLGRARPRISDSILFVGPTLRTGYDSFPSGHTTVAFCLAYVMSSYLPSYRAAFFGFAFLTAVDRVKGLSHFPSDIMAGALLGLVTGIALKRLSWIPKAPE